MTLRQRFLPIIDRLRYLSGPTAASGADGFDVRPHALTIRTKTWTGQPGTGTATAVDLAITPRPRVRQLSLREIAESGGKYRPGDVLVDKITPSYAGGGYTPAQLNPTVGRNVEVIYLITGPLAGEYSLKEARLDKSFGYALVLSRRNTTP